MAIKEKELAPWAPQCQILYFTQGRQEGKEKRESFGQGLVGGCGLVSGLTSWGPLLNPVSTPSHATICTWIRVFKHWQVMPSSWCVGGNCMSVVHGCCFPACSYSGGGGKGGLVAMYSWAKSRPTFFSAFASQIAGLRWMEGLFQCWQLYLAKGKVLRMNCF